MSDFLMVANDGEHEITIEKSRFICHVRRVFSIDEASSYIDKIRVLHAKANHNCVAYQIGDRGEFGKANDDGEPSGTAGMPMFEVLKKQNITNCLVVVTRYFGGVKLGSGGLIRAYSRAVSEAITQIGLVRRELMLSVSVVAGYALAQTIQARIEAVGYKLGEISYSEVVQIEVFVKNAQTSEFIDWITDISGGKVEMTFGDMSWKELPQI